MSTAVLFCLVIAVTSGEALSVRCGEAAAAQTLTVRVAGIQAPDPTHPRSGTARLALRQLCERQAVTLRPRTPLRAGGKVTADVECQGQRAADAQVRAGLAWALSLGEGGTATLLQAQQEARIARRGVWADGDADARTPLPRRP